MKSTNYWPRLTLAVESDDRFEELRVAYYARLRNDRGQVKSLRLQLASAGDPAPVYEAIRASAHSMAGAAAVFEATDIMNAARALEHTVAAASKLVAAKPAAAASKLVTEKPDSDVCTSMDSLVDLLNSICD
jgi:hypothetical protein